MANLLIMWHTTRYCSNISNCKWALKEQRADNKRKLYKTREIECDEVHSHLKDFMIKKKKAIFTEKNNFCRIVQYSLVNTETPLPVETQGEDNDVLKDHSEHGAW